LSLFQAPKLIAAFRLLKWFAESKKIAPAVFHSKPAQAKKNQCRNKSVAAGRVAVVRDYAKCLAQSVQRKTPDRRPV
jgi:hypothetical protein